RVNPSDYNNEAIRYASLNGHLEVVKELLKDKRVNPSDYNNEAIRYASLNGHLEVVKELLKDKRVNSMINHNELINIAAKKGYTDIVIELLKNGVDPVKFGNISIKQATLYGHTNIVNILRNHMGLNESLRDKLKGKSDEDITNVISDMKPLPLLRRSLESNYSKGIKLAIDKGARFDSTVIVKYSSKEDFYDIVKGLVDNNISLNLDHSYLLHHAVLKKYIDIVNYMISNGVDVNTYGILYSSSGQLEMTKLLLDNGANVNNNNGGYGDVFISSASGHNIDIFNLFLEYGVYKKYYVRALQHAKTNSHNPGTKKTIPILTKLIEETTNESLRDKLKGKSNDEINIELDKHQYNLMGKFNKACEYGLLNVVRDMLKNTNINPSANANLSLRLAIEGNHNEIVKELLKDRRVDPSSMNNTPISTSSLNNNLELVKILMKDKRVDPSYNNNILIGMVSRFGFLDIVKELLKDKRVDPSIDNNYALRWSKIKGYEEVAQYLEEHIKKNNK
ncbi:ankyrin repeat domain-containing protein, partial [Candidatus Babeliales bacterium]|nr:ankyrin repeat domain-containing protein [Candidatus Babeliales bacterium]